MRLPAVAIAALFDCGAVVGQSPWFAARVSSHVYVSIGFVGAAFLICFGIFLARIGRLIPAASVSLLSWIILGALDARISNQPRPADYVLTLVEAGEMALRAEVLKVGHHGSKNSTMPGFLAAVRPRAAVISAGEDKPYSHPTLSCLNALLRRGCGFYGRTATARCRF